MKRIISYLSLLLSFLFYLSGCSLTSFDSMLQNNIEDLRYNETVSIEPDKALPNEEIPEELQGSKSENEDINTSGTSSKDNKSEEGIIYATRGENKIAIELKGIGETYAELVRYKDAMGRETSNGKEGVYYTLNSVEVFENYKDANLSDEGKLLNSDAYFAQNQFILLEITANYIAPEGGEERIKVSPYLMASYVYEKMPDDFLTRVGIENLEPIDAWYSDPPKKGDSELDPVHDKNCFMVNDGESFTFKLGLLAGKEFVDNGNIFLRVGYLSDNTKDAVHQYFELFPNENYDWALTKEEAMFDAGKAYLLDNELYKDAKKIRIYSSDDKVVIKSIGDTLPMFEAYKYENKDIVEYLGESGLYVTLDKVTVYDSFHDSGLNYKDLPQSLQERIDAGDGFSDVKKQKIDTNYFIMVDVTYSYIAPEEGPQSITRYATFGLYSLAEKKNERLDNEQIMLQEPSPIYNTFKKDEEGMPIFTIRDGERLSFRFGISAGSEYVENNNIYWGVCEIGHDIEDYIFLLFELLPETAE